MKILLCCFVSYAIPSVSVATRTSTMFVCVWCICTPISLLFFSRLRCTKCFSYNVHFVLFICFPTCSSASSYGSLSCDHEVDFLRWVKAHCHTDSSSSIASKVEFFRPEMLEVLQVRTVFQGSHCGHSQYVGVLYCATAYLV